MEGALRMMDVAPDNLDAWLAAQADAEAKRRKAAGKTAPLASSNAALPVALASRASP